MSTIAFDAGGSYVVKVMAFDNGKLFDENPHLRLWAFFLFPETNEEIGKCQRMNSDVHIEIYNFQRQFRHLI